MIVKGIVVHKDSISIQFDSPLLEASALIQNHLKVHTRPEDVPSCLPDRI